MINEYAQSLGSKNMSWASERNSRTESSKMLHAFMLQTDTVNEYHKGMVRPKRRPRVS